MTAQLPTVKNFDVPGSASRTRIIPGTENTPGQRRSALVEVLRRAHGRADFLELAGMLGLHAADLDPAGPS